MLDPVVSYFQAARPMNWAKEFKNLRAVHLEIGFGLGEFLLEKARQNPDQNFVGLEISRERIIKTLKKIRNACIHNIRIVQVDAWVALERLFFQRSVTHMYSLFPCPWPKRKHTANRLFSKDFLRLINSRLKDEGRLMVVTDYLPYCEWILRQAKDIGFDVKTKDIKPQYGTKFEKKWSQGGQQEFFQLEFTKINHIDVAVVEDVKVQNYFIDRFDPEKFKIKNTLGKVNIIYKDFIYDSKRHKGIVYVIVKEQRLTQHFWVVITKGIKKWRIGSAPGNEVIYSPGIAEALKTIYEAAQATAQVFKK